MSLNNRKLVLTVLESGKSKCKVLANSALSWVADVHLLTVSSFGGREKGVETGPTDQYYCIQQQDGVMTVDEYDKREHLSKTYSVPDTDLSLLHVLVLVSHNNPLRKILLLSLFSIEDIEAINKRNLAAKPHF